MNTTGMTTMVKENPERRDALLGPNDVDDPIIQTYLSLHRERRPGFMAQAVRDGLISN